MNSSLTPFRPAKLLVLMVLFFVGFQMDPLAALRDTSTVMLSDNGATVTEIAVDITETLCNGEIVTVTGTWMMTSKSFYDNRGGLHYLENWNIHAEGVGDLGNTYRLNYSDNIVINAGIDDIPFVRTWPVAYVLIGQGTAPNLLYTALIHRTWNANGVRTAVVTNERLTCK